MSRKWILNNGKIKKISKDVELNLLTENLIFTEDNKVKTVFQLEIKIKDKFIGYINMVFYGFNFKKLENVRDYTGLSVSRKGKLVEFNLSKSDKPFILRKGIIKYETYLFDRCVEKFIDWYSDELEQEISLCYLQGHNIYRTVKDNIICICKKKLNQYIKEEKRDVICTL